MAFQSAENNVFKREKYTFNRQKNIMTRTGSNKQPDSVTCLKIHLILHIKKSTSRARHLELTFVRLRMQCKLWP